VAGHGAQRAAEIVRDRGAERLELGEGLARPFVRLLARGEALEPAREDLLVRPRVRGDVVEVVAHLGADDGHRMRAEDLLERGRVETCAFVLADPENPASRQEVVQAPLVFEEALGTRPAAEGPAHFAGDPQRRIAFGEGRVRGLFKEADHLTGVEEAVPEVALAAGQHGELAARQRGPGGQAQVVEVAQNQIGFVGVDQVNDFFPAEEAFFEEGADEIPVLSLVFVDRTDVIPRRKGIQARRGVLQHRPHSTSGRRAPTRPGFVAFRPLGTRLPRA
jgi:hypothetical protein